MARALQQNPTGSGYIELGDTDTLNVGNLQLLTGVAINAILDEDGLVSDSDTAVPTQQSVKAYVDSHIVKAENTDIDIGTEVVDSLPDVSAAGCVWHYVVQKGANLRAGTVTACWDAVGNAVKYFDTSTADIGSTADLTLSVGINIVTEDIELRATVVSDNWSVKVSRTSL